MGRVLLKIEHHTSRTLVQQFGVQKVSVTPFTWGRGSRCRRRRRDPCQRKGTRGAVPERYRTESDSDTHFRRTRRRRRASDKILDIRKTTLGVRTVLFTLFWTLNRASYPDLTSVDGSDRYRRRPLVPSPLDEFLSEDVGL